jgi:hypothetical protein
MILTLASSLIVASLAGSSSAGERPFFIPGNVQPGLSHLPSAP